MIYKNGHKIKRIRVGDNKEVFRVYFNDQVVFKRYHPVTAIVASTHDQWVETDMKDFWLDEIEWEVSFSNNVNSACIFGCRPDKSYQEFALLVTNDTTGSFNYRCGGDTINGSAPDAVKAGNMARAENITDIIGLDHGKNDITTSGRVYEISKINVVSFLNGHFYVNGVEYPFTEQKGYPFFLTYLPLHIFRLNQIDYNDGKTADNSNGIRYLYYARFWKKGVIYRDFIPVVDEDGVAALYDKVTKKFYYSAGSKPLEYISGNLSPISCIYGWNLNTYVDTQIKPKDIGKIELKLQNNSTVAVTSTNIYQMGSSRSDNTGFYISNGRNSLEANNASYYRLQIGDQTIITDVAFNTITETNITIDMINKKATINDATFDITTNDTLEDLPNFLLGTNNRGEIIVNTMKSDFRIYESKIYDKEGKLVQYLKPMLDREQVTSVLYDVVNEIPYYSAKTGKFLYI